MAWSGRLEAGYTQTPGTAPTVPGSNVTPSGADTLSSQASYASRASILQRTPFCASVAVLIQAIVGASSGSSGWITTRSPDLSVLFISSPCLSGRSSRVAACPVGELRERAAELAFQASDVGAVADTLEPLQHQRHIVAVLPDLFDWRLHERNRPTQRLRQDLRRLQHRSYVPGEIDLATVQAGGVGERTRAEPADVVHRN